MDSATKKRFVLRCLLPIGVLLLIASFALAISLTGVDRIGLFQLELDANADASLVQTSPFTESGDDWSTVNAGGGGTACPAGTGCTIRTGVLQDLTGSAGQNDDIFTGGGSKDISDISQWKWKFAGNTAVDKDDLTNVYAAAYRPTSGDRAGHLVIYFGADRFANSGNALLGFWFLHEGVQETGTGKGSGSSFTLGDGVTAATHTAATATSAGDILVLANLTSGGGVARMQVLEWDPNNVTGKQVSGTPLALLLDDASDSQAHCGDGNAAADACITTNASSTRLFWPYTTKGGTACTTGTNCTAPPVTFFEGGIDIDALVGTSTCFATFLAETRASSGSISNIDYNATLKDLRLGAFPVCGLSATKVCTGKSLDPSGDKVNYTFNGQVTVVGGAAYNVHITDTYPGSSTSESLAYDTKTGTVGTNTVCSGTTCSSIVPGTPATYTGGFTNPSSSGLTNSVSVTGCAINANPCPALDQLSGTASWNQATDTGGACAAGFTGSLQLHKGCTVNIVPGTSDVSLEVHSTGSVCNTGAVAWTNVIVKDTRGGGATPSSLNVIDLGTTELSPSECVTFSNDYIPVSCDTTDGRCSFSDTISVTKASADFIGSFDCTSGTCSGNTTLRPGDVTATCRVCPFGACSTAGNSTDDTPCTPTSGNSCTFGP